MSDSQGTGSLFASRGTTSQEAWGTNEDGIVGDGYKAKCPYCAGLLRLIREGRVLECPKGHMWMRFGDVLRVVER